MSNSNKFKVGDKVKRANFINGIWIEMCARHKLDKHAVHTVTSVSDSGGLGIQNMKDLYCSGEYTFEPCYFELVESAEPVIVACDSNIVAIVTKEQVVINNIAYPAKLIKDIAAALNFIQ